MKHSMELATIARLTALNEELTERLRQLEKELCPSIIFRPPVRLTAMEGDVLLALYNAPEGSVLSIEQIIARCPVEYTVDSFKAILSQLRKKLLAEGIMIINEYGRGYRALSGRSRATVAQWVIKPERK